MTTHDPASWRPALTCPWLFFDLETTSNDVAEAQVCELGFEIYDASSLVGPDGLPQPVFQWTSRFHPGCLIPEEATEIHGIRNDDVRGLAHVSYYRDWICDVLSKCVVCGYNSRRFDIPVLQKVLGANVPSQLDVMDLMKACADRRPARWRVRTDPQHGQVPLPASLMPIRHCKQKLGDSYTALRGVELLHAHSATADVHATAEIFFAAIDVYGLQADPTALVKLAWDYSGFVRPSERGLVIAVGKNEGRLLRDIWRRDPTFVQWMFKPDTNMDPISLQLVRQELGDAEVERCRKIRKRSRG